MNATTKHEQPEPARQQTTAVTPYDMMAQAVVSGASVEVVERLMGLHERWEANRARKAFDEAIASAKAEIPTVIKNRKGHNDTAYADFAAYATAVDPIISKFGLSYRFRTRQDGAITVTCILSHRDGHSEENSLTGPADKTGSKNDMQAIGSTLSYLQRYTLVQALGLAAGRDDDGKAAGLGAAISDEQLSDLVELLAETGSNMEVFLKYVGVDRLEDIPAAKFAPLVAKLQVKKAQQAKVKAGANA